MPFWSKQQRFYIRNKLDRNHKFIITCKNKLRRKRCRTIPSKLYRKPNKNQRCIYCGLLLDYRLPERHRFYCKSNPNSVRYDPGNDRVKIKVKKAYCQHCNKLMFTTNLKRHQSKCPYNPQSIYYPKRIKKCYRCGKKVPRDQMKRHLLQCVKSDRNKNKRCKFCGQKLIYPKSCNKASKKTFCNPSCHLKYIKEYQPQNYKQSQQKFKNTLKIKQKDLKQYNVYHHRKLFRLANDNRKKFNFDCECKFKIDNMLCDFLVPGLKTIFLFTDSRIQAFKNIELILIQKIKRLGYDCLFIDQPSNIDSFISMVNSQFQARSFCGSEQTSNRQSHRGQREQRRQFQWAI